MGEYMTPPPFVEQFDRMKFAVFVAACSIAFPLLPRPVRRPRPHRSRKAAEALRAVPARRITSRSAKTRTARSRPTSARWSSIRQAADIPAELAALYLRQSKVQEAMGAGRTGAEGCAGQSRSQPCARHHLRGAVGGRSWRRRRARGCRPGVVRQPRQGDSPSGGGARAADVAGRSRTCGRRWRAST